MIEKFLSRSLRCDRCEQPVKENGPEQGYTLVEDGRRIPLCFHCGKKEEDEIQ